MVTRTEAKRLMNQVSAAATHYEVLGVPPGVEPEPLKGAHRKLAGIFHPDRCIVTGAHDVMTRINGAYAVLSDKEARRKYDMTLGISKTKCVTCEGSGSTYKQRGFARRVSVECRACGGTGVCE
jgi:DnaJ-class molecular chaperone